MTYGQEERKYSRVQYISVGPNESYVQVWGGEAKLI